MDAEVTVATYIGKATAVMRSDHLSVVYQANQVRRADLVAEAAAERLARRVESKSAAIKLQTKHGSNSMALVRVARQVLIGIRERVLGSQEDIGGAELSH